MTPEKLQQICELENGLLTSYAWPGGYTLFYVTKDCSWLCPKCANKNRELTKDKHNAQWYIIDVLINYEYSNLYCDNCNEMIESAYGEKN